jgi:ABC-type lipoprotein release transport system permease subunit
MTGRTIIFRSVRFYWRTHLGVILGAALGAMVLIGALLVGDSVKATLQRQAELRVGNTDLAMTGGDRFFRAALADAAGADTAPVLMVRATVARADGGARVNAAQLLGVDGRFWKLSPAGTADELPADGVALNTRIAQQLGVVAGDTVIVRVEKPGMFSKDAPLSGDESDAVALRVKVARIVDDEHYGRFALSASQVPPFTVFAPLAMLQEKLDLPGKANLLLWPPPTMGTEVVARQVNLPFAKKPTTVWSNTMEFGLDVRASALREDWTLDDASLNLLDLPNNSGLELRSSRVFLDPPVIAAAPAGKDNRRVDALTYFVNELRSGDKATPYSMVTAVETASSGFLPAELADDEMVISQWLADDLGIGTGAKVTLKYFTMGERRELTEKSRVFTVLAVLPMTEPQLNDSWMPDFPGLKDAKNCRDWKPGFAIDMTKMQAKDNDYWQEHKGTPKAFVNLRAGQEMWGNRWGNTTSLRWPAGTDRAEIEKALREKLTPEQLGFQFIPLREQALAATKAPVDFGELFVSFSFFLIAAAAVLTGLLFVFTLEQRNAEAGTLLALGLPPRMVRRMLLGEGVLLAVIGTVLGVGGALVFTKLVLRGLATVWSGAVGGVEFQFAATPGSIVGGAVGSVFVAMLAMWLASRRQLRHSARELLSGEFVSEAKGKDQRRGAETQRDAEEEKLSAKKSSASLSSSSASSAFPIGTAMVCIALALAIPIFTHDAEAFFGAGSLLLIAGICAALALLRRSANAAGGIDTLSQLGTRNAARRRGRSLATIAVLASGVFMVVAVDSFRHQPLDEYATSDPGTGGFALVGESALPIYEDLNSEKGREAYGLDEKIMKDVHVVPMRVRDGDDASCLNLNRAMEPRVLGVEPNELDRRNAFQFAEYPVLQMGNEAHFERIKAGYQWPVLYGTQSMVPAVVDAATLQWALQMKIGSILEYRDDHGDKVKLVPLASLTGSILQGSLVIGEKQFVRYFPNSAGYRFFLIDCPREKITEVREHLSRQLADRGLELTTTAHRLAEFQAVENTYLSIFQVLGGLGLLLGSAGLAIVVARNVLERRREFGLLEAVGFRPQQLRAMVFAEHRWLIAAALLIGTAGALVAVWPNLSQKAAGFPLREMALLLAGLVIGCVFWTWLATRLALRGSAVPALRAE